MSVFEKKHLFWLRFLAFLASAALFLLVTLCVGAVAAVQRMQHYEQQAAEIMATLETVSDQLGSVDWVSLTAAVNSASGQLAAVDLTATVTRLDEICAALSEIDLVGMAGDMDTLMATAQDSLNKAQEGLALAQKAVGELDVETLNTAIAELQSVLEPLARFFGNMG